MDLPEVTAGCWHGYAPGVGPGHRSERWLPVVDTARADPPGEGELRAGQTMLVEARSVVLLQRLP